MKQDARILNLLHFLFSRALDPCLNRLLQESSDLLHFFIFSHTLFLLIFSFCTCFLVLFSVSHKRFLHEKVCYAMGLWNLKHARPALSCVSCTSIRTLSGVMLSVGSWTRLMVDFRRTI